MSVAGEIYTIRVLAVLKQGQRYCYSRMKGRGSVVGEKLSKCQSLHTGIYGILGYRLRGQAEV